MDNKTRLVEMAVAVCYLAEILVAFTLMVGHGLWQSLAGKGTKARNGVPHHPQW